MSPLAPAAVLLLSAFILSQVVPRLPAGWQRHPVVRSYSVPLMVGLAGISLVFIRIPTDESPLPQLISGWNFGTAQSAAGLTVQIDPFSLPFLLIVVFMLLVVALLCFDPTSQASQEHGLSRVAGWLLLGAGACLPLIAANGLTLIHAVVAFDLLAAFFGMGPGRRYYGAGATRIFLGVLTAAAIILSSLSAPYGLFVLGLALWLRLGVIPFLEASALIDWDVNERLIYQGLTLTVGIYLTFRVVNDPLPELVRWFIVALMLLSGLLTWLTSLDESEAGKPPEQFRWRLLGWLLLTEALLLLLTEPLPTGARVAFAVGLMLSWLALLITPALGQPRLREQAWSWPYLPAATATFTLIGVPFSLGWLAKLSIYESLISNSNLVLVLFTLAAETLALSGLVRYWLMLVRGHDRNNRWLAISILAMVPFLTPGLAPFILAGLTGMDLYISSASPSVGAIVTMVAVVGMAIVIGFQRQTVLTQLNLPVKWLNRFACLTWLPGLWQQLFDRLSRGILRLRVIIEGQHYIGWAILMALIGSLIILLS